MLKKHLIILLLLITTGCITTNPFEQKNAANDPSDLTLLKPNPVITPPSRLGEVPIAFTVMKKTPDEASSCLLEAIQKTFKIPDEFIKKQVFVTEGLQTISLVNPSSEEVGVNIDLLPHAEGSEAKMYDNGTIVSNAWKNLLKKCE